MAAVASWWLAVSVLGVLALPLAFWLLGRLPGRGLMFARPLGLLFSAYVLWLGASTGILRNDTAGILIAICALAGLSAWLSLRRRDLLPELLLTLRQERGTLVVSELLFGLGFAAWAVLRAYSADKIMPSGGEKFMEMAFLNAVLNSPHFPPLDPWLSGFTISYYYFGYVQMGFLTRLTAIPSGVAFELYDAFVFALALQLPFALASEMAAISKFDRFRRIFSGLFASLFTAVIGNLEGLLEALHARGWLPARVSTWLALPDFPPPDAASGAFYPGHDSWWWWRASRVISDLDLSGQRIPANPITEFPFFSFLLGDNHPHVLALPFTLLAAALALDWARRGSLRAVGIGSAIPRLLFSALILGALIFLNTWDFPTALILALLAFLAGQYTRQGRLLRVDWIVTFLRAFVLILGAGLLVLTFLLSFQSQAGGVLPYVFPPTRLVQYLVMFAPFVTILALFLPLALAASSLDSAQPFSLRRAGSWWLRLVAASAGLFGILVALGALILAVDQILGGIAAVSLQPWLGGGSLSDKVLRILAARAANPWLFLLLTCMITLAAAVIASAPRRPLAASEAGPVQDSSQPDLGLLIAALFILAGLALTFSVEFIYLRDSFSVRMNTVFKFYFQAWVLLSCACGYAIGWISHHARPAARAASFVLAGVVVLVCLVYPVLAVAARTRAFTTQPSLDGTARLRADNPDDWAAIDWLIAQPRLNDNVPLILEAPCQSYCYAGRVSAFTGFPAVLGWISHEAQWRGSRVEQNRRLEDIAAIYTAEDARQMLELLSKWDVEYVILGPPEREYLADLCRLRQPQCSPGQAVSRLDQTLIPVFHQGDTTIYQVPSSK